MKPTTIILALLDISVAALLLSRKHDAQAVSVPLDPKEARLAWSIGAGFMLLNALVLLVSLPNA